MTSPDQSVISVEYLGRVAVLTIDNQRKLNALSGYQYYDLARRMLEVAARDEVVVTVLTAKGRFFSAGADVSLARSTPDQTSDPYQLWLQSFVANNLNVTRAFYTHPKILVVGLNGPVVGLSAALIAHADFIYATPSTYLLTPFSSLGLLAEGGSSRALVRRLGPTRANEALLMSRRLTCPQLVASGFVNEVFDDVKAGDDVAFKGRLLHEVEERLGEHLNGDSLLGIKRLIRGPEDDAMELQNLREHFGGLERFVRGIPQEEFRKLASGEKRHKL